MSMNKNQNKPPNKFMKFSVAALIIVTCVTTDISIDTEKNFGGLFLVEQNVAYAQFQSRYENYERSTTSDPVVRLFQGKNIQGLTGGTIRGASSYFKTDRAITLPNGVILRYWRSDEDILKNLNYNINQVFDANKEYTVEELTNGEEAMNNLTELPIEVVVNGVTYLDVIVSQFFTIRSKHTGSYGTAYRFASADKEKGTWKLKEILLIVNENATSRETHQWAFIDMARDYSNNGTFGAAHVVMEINGRIAGRVVRDDATIPGPSNSRWEWVNIGDEKPPHYIGGPSSKPSQPTSPSNPPSNPPSQPTSPSTPPSNPPSQPSNPSTPSQPSKPSTPSNNNNNQQINNEQEIGKETFRSEYLLLNYEVGLEVDFYKNIDVNYLELNNLTILPKLIAEFNFDTLYYKLSNDKSCNLVIEDYSELGEFIKLENIIFDEESGKFIADNNYKYLHVVGTVETGEFRGVFKHQVIDISNLHERANEEYLPQYLELRQQQEEQTTQQITDEDEIQQTERKLTFWQRIRLFFTSIKDSVRLFFSSIREWASSINRTNSK